MSDPEPSEQPSWSPYPQKGQPTGQSGGQPNAQAPPGGGGQAPLPPGWIAGPSGGQFPPGYPPPPPAPPPPGYPQHPSQPPPQAPPYYQPPYPSYSPPPPPLPPPPPPGYRPPGYIPPGGGSGFPSDAATPPDQFVVDIGMAFREGARIVNDNLAVFLGYSLVAFLISLAASSVYIGGMVVAGPLMAGFFGASLKAYRGEKIEFSDFWQYWGTAPVYLFSIVTSLLTAFGMLFCLIPGIYLVVSYMIGMPLVLDRRLDFWPAAELSRKSIGKGWWMMFLFALIFIFLTGLGTLFTCGLGFFYFWPWYIAACTVIYRANFPEREEAPQTFAPQPPYPTQPPPGPWPPPPPSYPPR